MLGERTAGNTVTEIFCQERANGLCQSTGLDLASISDMTKIVRSYGHPFRGWLTKTANDIRHLNCEVQSDPNPENPYHALIVLPTEVAADRDRQKHKVRELAEVCEWNEPVGD